MKKLLILSVCLISVVSVSATILFTSSCGEQTYTVSPEYFKDWDEALRYYEDLNDILCDQEDSNADQEDTDGLD